ncbi:unnamed protein product, partial [marine sediment metagenome]
IKIDLAPSANFGQCALQAAFAAAPVFLKALMDCLTGVAPPSGGYLPGDRSRCN